MSKMEFKKSVVMQLHSMLTNHPEKEHNVLNVFLADSTTKDLIMKDSFEIYTNHPENKIMNKVNKLASEGGIRTLICKNFLKVSNNEYVLSLEV